MDEGWFLFITRLSHQRPWCSDTVKDYQDGAITLIRDVGVPRPAFWNDLGFSGGCLPLGHFPQRT
eukprot:4914061-Pyramimonas_sp.AAC.1